MAEKTWAQQAVDEFFEARASPTQIQCHETARSISGASEIKPVDIPGSLSYTVVCTGRQEGQPGLIVSFRESESGLDSDMVRLATEIHGSLVPEVTPYGMMKGADPPLAIYAMTYLPGIPCLEALSHSGEMDSEDEARHSCYVKHLARQVTIHVVSVGSLPDPVLTLARYFARSWSNPQLVDAQVRAERQAEIHCKLVTFKQCPSPSLPSSAVSELVHNLSVLFSQEHPQVLTHGDLSRTNILVDMDTYEITGIVDWSLAGVLPFGLELDCLYLMTGYMDLSGWYDYTCRPRLYEAFWAEFWAASGVEDSARREEVRTTAESAAKIGAILRYAFKRNPDGSPSEVLLGSDRMSKYLKPWFIG
jgi:hypothetical protein